MSKRFKTQDYFRYKKLGKRWRRPVGLQSKLRIRKGGSGMKVSIGYGSAGKALPTLVANVKDFEKDCSAGVLLSSGVGSKKTAVLAAKAKELNITVLNMRKVKRASRLGASLKKKKDEQGKIKGEKKEAKESKSKKAEEEDEKEEKESKEKAERKMGFYEGVMPQVLAGKTKTYRLRDHGLNVGDKVTFENSQTGEIFGHGKITKIEHIPVSKINLNDALHGATYNNHEELIAAFKRHYPEREVNLDTEAFVYTYEFTPAKSAGGGE